MKIDFSFDDPHTPPLLTMYFYIHKFEPDKGIKKWQESVILGWCKQISNVSTHFTCQPWWQLSTLSGIRSDKILRPHLSRYVPIKAVLERKWHIFQRADKLICLSQMPNISEDNLEITSMIHLKKKTEKKKALLYYWWVTRNLLTSFLHSSTLFVLH